MLEARAVIELVYKDASGSSGAVTLHIPVTTTYGQADVAASAVASVLASITSCVLVRQRIKYTVVRDPSTPAAFGSSIKRRGVFFFDTDDGSQQCLIEIPGILDSVLMTTGNGAGVLKPGKIDHIALVLCALAKDIRRARQSRYAQETSPRTAGARLGKQK